MATYKFRCLKCNTESEHQISMKEVKAAMELTCPSCETKTFQKQVINLSPVHFRGSGWPGKEIK